MDLKVENAILWGLVNLAEEGGTDFNQWFETELDEYADEIREMDYWQSILYCAGHHFGLLGDHSDTENMP